MTEKILLLAESEEKIENLFRSKLFKIIKMFIESQTHPGSSRVQTKKPKNQALIFLRNFLEYTTRKY